MTEYRIVRLAGFDIFRVEESYIPWYLPSGRRRWRAITKTHYNHGEYYDTEPVEFCAFDEAYNYWLCLELSQEEQLARNAELWVVCL